MFGYVDSAPKNSSNIKHVFKNINFRKNLKNIFKN